MVDDFLASDTHLFRGPYVSLGLPFRRAENLKLPFSRNFPPSTMTFAQVGDFKGLENDAIVVIDLPEPNPKNKQAIAPHYVAMSRAKAVLSMIYHETG